MKKSRIILTASAVLILIIFIAGLLFIRNISRSALPDYNKDVSIQGLSSEVTVLRDGCGVPSIYAENEQDLYRAVGFIMAQDRLWQMDLLRRATTGRLAEIFGEDLVNTDLLMRSLRIPEKSELILSRTDKEIIEAIEAFADGVNQYIEMQGDKLPPEFAILGYKPEKWEPVHSVNLTGYMAWDLNTGWSSKVILQKLHEKLDEALFNELIPDLELHKSYVHPSPMISKAGLRSEILTASDKLAELGLAVFSGSNNWVVSGKKSTTGKPLFANDMHLGLFAPGIWYQMHQVVEGQLNVTGVVVPGQPFVISGHNEKIAWGMTNVMVDDMDFYLETVNPDNPRRYKYMGRWKDMEVRKETVKTGEDKSVERELLFTHRGPVVSSFKGMDDRVITMKWTGNEYSNEMRSVYLLNRASNWQEFRNALSTFLSVSQNVNYADVDGNIGIQTSAGVPIRKSPALTIVPGEDNTYDWLGMVPFEKLPYTYNPPEGFVASANNRTVPDGYPHYISHWFDTPNRYDRIKEMLTEKELLSVDDFKKMLADKKSKLPEKIIPSLLDELQKNNNLTHNEKKAVEILAGWDYVYDEEDSAPLIFEKFYNRFVENLLIEEMGDDLYREFIKNKSMVRNIFELVWKKDESAWIKGNKSETGPGSFAYLVHTSFSETVEWIEKNLSRNPDRWEWGDVHTMTLEHPIGSVNILNRLFNLNKGPYSPGGSFHTVCPYAYDFRNPFAIDHGASQRHIYSTADWDQSFSIIPTGTSGIPASDYYCDQTDMYVNDEYRRDNFSSEAVKQAAEYSMKLTPEDG